MSQQHEVLDISVDDFVEITLAEPDDFLKIRETLTRIGISSNHNKKLYQSCHIFHKRGQYYIVHFKELLAFDGLPVDISTNDIARRNKIALLLEEWDLLEIVDDHKVEDPVADIKQIKVLPHREKKNWILIPKYRIGNS